MSLYRVQEGAFDIPEQLHDCSVNVFTLSRDEASDFSVIVTREPHRSDESGQECGDRLIAAALAEAPGSTVMRRFHESLRVGRAYGVELVIKLGNTPVVQRVLIVPLRPTTLVFTASAKHAFTAEQSAWFTKITSSLER